MSLASSTPGQVTLCCVSEVGEGIYQCERTCFTSYVELVRACLCTLYNVRVCFTILYVRSAYLGMHVNLIGEAHSHVSACQSLGDLLAAVCLLYQVYPGGEGEKRNRWRYLMTNLAQYELDR